mmetsp:Transcript_3448/g.9906  ORF Transcript_3448/g.9906 Transcript_3448/m.9906 type:complete len:1527 (+) Transcript_3448:155-4735(+)
MEGLYIQSLSPSTSVQDAAVGSFTDPHRQQLLVAKPNALEVWQLSDEEGEGMYMAEERIVHERLEFIRVLERQQGRAPEECDVVVAMTSDYVVQLLRWDAGIQRFRCIGVAQAQAPRVDASEPPALPCMAGPVISEQHTLSTKGVYLFSGALYTGFLHIIHIKEPRGASRAAAAEEEEEKEFDWPMSILAVKMPALPGPVEGHLPGELAITVLSTAFLPLRDGVDRDGRPLLVVLHESKGYINLAVNLQCLSLDVDNWQLLPGPWVVRNLHPSTALLKVVRRAAACGQQGGVVAIGSTLCRLYTKTQPGPSVALAMGGLPKAVTEMYSLGALLIGDSAGLLWQIGMPEREAWCAHPISLAGPSATAEVSEAGNGASQPPATQFSVPEVLCCLEAARKYGEMVFLGSHQGPSQLLQPPALPPVPTPTQSAAPATANAAGGGGWALLDPEMVASLAPIADAQMFEHPPGSGEKHLALCCGSAPKGRLAIVSMAAERTALAEAAECLDGMPVLSSMEAGTAKDGCRAYLVMSFHAPPATQVMELVNGCLSPCVLPGLDASSITLLCAAVPGGWLVQVTPTAVLVLDRAPACTHHSDWAAPSPVTHACVSGSHLLLACGSVLHSLVVDEPTGRAAHLGSTPWPRQVSALVQLRVKAGGGAPPSISGGGLHASVVATWQDSRLTLCSSGDLGGEPLAVAQLPDGQQARSITAVELQDSQSQVVVGTSTGMVAVYGVVLNTEGRAAGGAVGMNLLLTVWAGNSPAHLSVLKDPATGKDMVYAQSSQDVLLRAWKSNSSSTASTISPLRVHGREQAASLVGLLAPSSCEDGSNACTVAWVDRDGRLLLGSLDPEPALRWHACDVKDTPVAAAYHKESRCCIAICTGVHGGTTIRLVHVDSMQQVALLHLEAHHKPCAVLSAPLPCSSVAKAKQDAFPAEIHVEKEFVLVSSWLLRRDPTQGGAQTATGILSVFDILHSRTAGADRFQVVLHAAQPLPGVCHCVAAVPLPPHQLKGEGSPGSSRDPLPPMGLLLGCQDSLMLAEVFVDDIASWSLAAEMAALDFASVLSSSDELARLRGDGPKGEMAESPEEADGQHEAASQPQGSQESAVGVSSSPSLLEPETRWEIWRQRMKLEVMSTAPSQTGGCIISLSTRGTSVLASEFLGAVGMYNVLSPAVPGGTPLLAQVGTTSLPVFSPAVCQLTPTLSLLSTQPYGFALLGTDLTAQADCEAQVRLRAEKSREAGASRAAQQAPQGPASVLPQGRSERAPERVRGGPANADAAVPAPEMQPLGLCRKPQIVVKYCHGHLGIPAIEHGGNSRGDCSSARGGGSARNDTDPSSRCAVYVTACGSIGSVELIGKEDAANLHHLQAAVDLATSASVSDGGPPWAATSHQHSSMWHWTLADLIAAGRSLGPPDYEHMDMDDGRPLPAACIDGDILQLLRSTIDGPCAHKEFAATAEQAYDQLQVVELPEEEEAAADRNEGEEGAARQEAPAAALSWSEAIALSSRMAMRMLSPAFVDAPLDEGRVPGSY